MRELVDDGLVETSYSVNRVGLPGRSQVLFEPTKKGLNLVESHRLKQQSPQHSDAARDEWHEISNNLLEKITTSFEEESTLSFDFEDERYKSSPVAYCAAFLSFLFIEAKRKGLDLVALKGILEIGSENGLTLSLFIGLLIGGLLVQGARKVLPELEELIHSFSQQVEHLEDSNKEMLLEFAHTVVNQQGMT